MTASTASSYENEIREYLVGRLSRTRTAGSIRGARVTLPTSPILDWWLFEGKRYRGLENDLSHEWGTVARQARRLAQTYNPHWKDAALPEGDVDWLATALAMPSSPTRSYVCRTSSHGLTPEEANALEGWRNWIGERWRRYIKDVGVPLGVSEELPWASHEQPIDSRHLRRWAFVAKRSRWPLLRNVVAEGLRAAFEPDLVNQLPLPAEPARLFELLCLVRILRALVPDPHTIRWLDHSAGKNIIRMPGITCHYQLYVDPATMLATAEYSRALREAVDRHRVRLPAYIDGLVVFDQPRGGFHGLLIEAKSGAQTYDAAVHQLKCYRAALSATIPGPLIVWGITEHGDVGHWQEREKVRVQVHPSTDFWLFSPAACVATALAGFGLERHADQVM